MEGPDNYLKIVVPDFTSDKATSSVSEIFLFRSRDLESVATAKAQLEKRKGELAAGGSLARVSIFRRIPSVTGIPLIGEMTLAN